MAMERVAFNHSELPEDCIVNVLSRTSPCDVGRLSLVSSTFSSAADSDAVWIHFLPPNNQSLVTRSTNSSYLRSLPLKELYFCICGSPILNNDGMKSFSRDRWTGKKCYMLSARALKIVWGDTPRYWGWTSSSDPVSRFPEVAVLLAVCWLEISGKINVEILSPATRYAAYLVFSWTDAAFGFENRRIEVGVGLVGSQSSLRDVYLDTPGQEDNNREYPKERTDGWLEIELGEITTGEGVEGELEMRFLGMHGGNWKRGLVICGIEIRLKVVNYG